MSNMSKCSFTGHRVIKKDLLPHVIKRLDVTVSSLINQGVVTYLSGGAIGFDTYASLTVIKYRENNPLIKLIMVLPCLNQDERWNEKDKQTYRYLLDNADKIIYVSERLYYQGCMLLRNEYLIEHSDVCVAYMLHGRSGTSQTVRLAREQGLKVINLAED